MNVTAIKDIAYSQNGHALQKLDLYLPKDQKDFKTVIFFHGGGLEGGDKEGMEAIGIAMAKKGVAFVAPGYRKFPEVQYPAFIEDGAEALQWVTDHLGQYGNCSEIYLGGHSAGAYLAMMLCFDPRFGIKERGKSPKIAGYVFASGQPTTHFNILKYRGIDERGIVVDDAAPLYHIRECMDTARIMILVTDQDIPSRWEQSALLYSTLKHFNYKVEQLDFRILKGYDHSNYLDTKDSNGHYPIVSLMLEFIGENDK